jgi:hypothetical protein
MSSRVRTFDEAEGIVDARLSKPKAQRARSSTPKGARARNQQNIDSEALKHLREAQVRFGPGESSLQHSVLIALHARRERRNV